MSNTVISMLNLRWHWYP